MEIHEALLALDTADDSKWTGEGLPRVEFVGELVGRELSRQEITDAAPKFTRETPVIEEMTKEEKLATATEVADEAQVKVQEAADAEAEATQKREAEQIKLQAALKEKEQHEEPAHVKKQKTIMAWAKKQNEVRKQRAENRRKLLGGLGVTADDLDPRAPIDKAYAGGQKRPEGG